MNKISLIFVSGLLISGYTRVRAQNNADTASAVTTSRAIASPLQSLPFPNSDWDGGSIIGAPNDETYYPLQKFLYLANDKAKIRVYGWVDVGGNLSSSTHS